MGRLRRYKKQVIGLAAALAVVLLSAGAAAAASSHQFVSGTNNHTVYKAGQTVTVTGTVNGDIFCAGQTVDIDATVNGDVICAGQTVTVNGKVNGNVRLAGQTVNLGAKVSGNASVAAQDTTLAGNAGVGQDLTLLSQTANVDGSVGRDVHGAIQTMVFSSSVGRNVDVTAAKLHLGSDARISGSLTYASPEHLTKDNGAVVSGATTYTKTAQHHGGWHFSWWWLLYPVAAMLVTSMVLVALWPQVFVSFNRYAAPRAGWALLTGFIALFLAPVLFFVLAITVVGLPLAFMFGLAWLLAIFWSVPLAAYYIGSLIFRGERPAPLVMLVGSLVLVIAILIPIIGFIATMLAVWFGLGNLLLNLRPSYKRPVYRPE